MRRTSNSIAFFWKTSLNSVSAGAFLFLPPRRKNTNFLRADDRERRGGKLFVKFYTMLDGLKIVKNYGPFSG